MGDMDYEFITKDNVPELEQKLQAWVDQYQPVLYARLKGEKEDSPIWDAIELNDVDPDTVWVEFNTDGDVYFLEGHDDLPPRYRDSAFPQTLVVTKNPRSVANRYGPALTVYARCASCPSDDDCSCGYEGEWIDLDDKIFAEVPKDPQAWIASLQQN